MNCVMGTWHYCMDVAVDDSDPEDQLGDCDWWQRDLAVLESLFSWLDCHRH